MRWTSTEVQHWQEECDRLAQTGEPFELRNVEDHTLHQHFFLVLCGKHGYRWRVLEDDHTILFTRVK